MLWVIDGRNVNPKYCPSSDPGAECGITSSPSVPAGMIGGAVCAKDSGIRVSDTTMIKSVIIRVFRILRRKCEEVRIYCVKNDG